MHCHMSLILNKNRLEKISRGTIVAIFFLPLLITPGVLFPYQYGKIVIFELLSGVLAALTLLVASSGFKFKATPVFWAYFSFVAMRLVLGFAGENPAKSFFGDHIRMTGTLTFIYLFIFFILIRHFFRGIGNELKLLRAVAISGAAGAMLAIVQRFTSLGADVLGESGDWLFGSFGNPSYFAGYLVLVIFFTAILAARETSSKVKIFWSAACLGEAGLLVATSSRGAIVGLFLGMVAAGIVLLINSKKKSVRFAGITMTILPVILLSGALAIYFGPGRASAPGRFLGSLLRSSTAETRLINWRIAVDSFKEKPILGWGPENFEIPFSKFYRPELVKYSFTETWVDRPHNIMLEVAAGGGMAGVASYLILFAVPAYIVIFRKKDSISNADKALSVGALAAFLGQGLFLFDTWSALLLFTALLAFIDLWTRRGVEAADSAGNVPENKFLKSTAALIILSATFVWAVLPVRASWLAAHAEEDLARRNYASFEKNFLNALQAYTPYRDDLAKMLSDDILKGDAAKVIPPEVTKSVLVPLAEYVEISANKHPNVYALVFRSAEMFALAGEYISSEYFIKAEKMFDRAEALSPERQTTDIMRVQMELSRGRTDEALRQVEALVASNPDFSEVRWLYGLVLVAAGDADAAEEQFDKFLKTGFTLSSPTVGGIFTKTKFILDFYASRGSFGKMLPILERFVKMYPDAAEYHMRLAAVYATLGRFDEARSEALKTISADPSRRADVEEFIRALEDLSR